MITLFIHNGRQYFMPSDGFACSVWNLDTGQRSIITDAENRAAWNALIAGDKAMTYAWGRQDAGDGTNDSDRAIDFGNAYALHVFRFEMQLHYCQTNIKHAFESWRTTGTIDD